MKQILEVSGKIKSFRMPEAPMKPYIWKKSTTWSKIRTFLCGMEHGMVLHGDKMESIPDLVNFERAKKPMRK